jgi:hypothetical protein
MESKRNPKGKSPHDARVPVCDVVLPFPAMRPMMAAVTVLYELQRASPGPLNIEIHVEMVPRNALRIRGFRGIDLDFLTAFIRAVLTQCKLCESVSLSYRPGCLGKCARPDGGILQITAGCVASHAFREDRANSLTEPPGDLVLTYPEAEPNLH